MTKPHKLLIKAGRICLDDFNLRFVDKYSFEKSSDNTALGTLKLELLVGSAEIIANDVRGDRPSN